MIRWISTFVENLLLSYFFSAGLKHAWTSHYLVTVKAAISATDIKICSAMKIILYLELGIEPWSLTTLSRLSDKHKQQMALHSCIYRSQCCQRLFSLVFHLYYSTWNADQVRMQGYTKGLLLNRHSRVQWFLVWSWCSSYCMICVYEYPENKQFLTTVKSGWTADSRRNWWNSITYYICFESVPSVHLTVPFKVVPGSIVSTFRVPCPTGGKP